MIAILILAGAGSYGAWQTFLGLEQVMVAWQSSTWPSTEAQIRTSEVVQTKSSSRRSNGSSYRPKIEYSYIINSGIYAGTEIAPGRIWGSSSSNEVVAQFPVGSQARIYFESANPARSVMLAGVHAYSFGTTAFGSIFLTLACLSGVVLGRMSASLVRIIPAWLLPLLGSLILVEIILSIWLSSI